VGGLQLQSRYLLAPLAGYTNLPYRLAVRGVGGLGLATTDLINARALLMRSRKTLELLQTCPEDRPVAIQIYGSNPSEMKDAAQWLQEYGASTIDLNMGCPVNKIVRNGGGSALMCDAVNTVKLVGTIVEAVKIPVTVKMRLGWDANDLLCAGVRARRCCRRYDPWPHPGPGIWRHRRSGWNSCRCRSGRARPHHRQWRCS
jgi:tRNA-dihydrouridine synthase